MRILSRRVQSVTHSPESVFGLWTDPLSWSTWDPDVTEVRFGGEMVVGAKGWMRPSGGPAATFEVTALETDRLFTDVSRLPGARLSFEHAIERADEGSVITVTIGVDGPLSGLWRLMLCRTFRDAASRNIVGLNAYLDAE